MIPILHLHLNPFRITSSPRLAEFPKVGVAEEHLMRFGIVLGLTVLMSATILGQTTLPAPTTTPTTTTAPTQPAPVPSTPKETLRSLNIALRDGDTATVQAIFLTRDESGARLIAAMADYSAALVGLHKAAESAYGPEGAKVVTGDINAQSADGLAALDKAEVKIDGDTALVKLAGATDPPVMLVRVDGRWKVPLSQLLDGADKSVELQRYRVLTMQAGLARKTAEEVSAGKFREGAIKAAELASRLLEPMAPRPATRP